MICDRDAAFDVTQETFVRAFQKIDSFDGRAAISTWLYRNATNEVRQCPLRRETERRRPRIVAQQRASSPESDVPGDYSAD
jgi:DNA-directed RNA polymerase specialized sigma24 family protein